MRLDKYIVDKFALKSRQYAQTLIKEGFVCIDGIVVDKASFEVDEKSKVEINDFLKYVGRGGLKLEKALSVFDIDVKNSVCMDIGASTGGFTDCLLQNGADKVYAVDVGHGQLAEKLRNDPRVVNLENTNIKDLEPNDLSLIQIITVDVSFISLGKIAEKISAFDPEKLICLIKPQFENAKVNKNGIVKDRSQYKKVILNVCSEFEKFGYYMNGLAASPVKGGDGNVEFISYFTKTPAVIPLTEMIRNAEMEVVCL